MQDYKAESEERDRLCAILKVQAESIESKNKILLDTISQLNSAQTSLEQTL